MPEFESGIPRLALTGTPAEGTYRKRRDVCDGQGGSGRSGEDEVFDARVRSADFQVGLEEKKDAAVAASLSSSTSFVLGRLPCSRKNVLVVLTTCLQQLPRHLAG